MLKSTKCLGYMYIKLKVIIENSLNIMQSTFI